MSIANIFLTQVTNKDKITGYKLGIDTAGTITKSYTENGSLLLTGATTPLDPAQIYDYIQTEDNITKTLTIDNKTKLKVPYVTNATLNSILTSNNLIVKQMNPDGTLLLNSDDLMTYINDNLDLKLNHMLMQR
jgi:hypothetical protein